MARAHELDIAAVPAGREILKQYKEMLEQKVRPDFSAYINRNFKPWFEEVTARHEVFFKWWEEKRLCRRFAAWTDYAEVPVKFDASGRCLKFFAANFARMGMPKSLKELKRYMLPLRERCADAMPLLLFEPTESNLARAAKILRAPAPATHAQLIARYFSLWH
jgi:hypothetical protein